MRFHSLLALIALSLPLANANAVISLSEKSHHEIDLLKEDGVIIGVQIFVSRDAFEGCLNLEVSGDRNNESLGEFCPYQVEFEKDGQPLSLSKTFKVSKYIRYGKKLSISHVSGKPLEVLEVRVQLGIYTDDTLLERTEKAVFPVKIPATKQENVIKREVRAGIWFEKPDVRQLYVAGVSDEEVERRGKYFYSDNSNTYDYVPFLIDPSATKFDLKSKVLDGNVREFGPLANTKVISIEIKEQVYWLKTVTVYK